MIDPTFWEDEEIGTKWSHSARLFYIGLWNFSDDEGRFKAHPALLKAQIFPYETDIQIVKLKKEVSNKVQWYEVNGSQYGFLLNFLKHQRIDRPTASKLPIPPPINEGSTNTQRDVLANISKVNISKVKPSFPFKEIWNNYPSKIGSKRAEKSFKASVKNEKDWLDIQTALKNYCASESVAKGYVQNGSTWFNNWRDWIVSPEKKKTGKQYPAYKPTETIDPKERKKVADMIHNTAKKMGQEK